jgi:alkylation response protein AidB-like acyl-CoA dehydrogenase
MRSAFLMTEPAVASSDATNIETSIRREGNEYVINGRKWWSSGVGDPRCKIAIVLGKTDPSAPRHQQQSQILVPLDAPGITKLRPLNVFGFDDALPDFADGVDAGSTEVMSAAVTITDAADAAGTISGSGAISIGVSPPAAIGWSSTTAIFSTAGEAEAAVLIAAMAATDPATSTAAAAAVPTRADERFMVPPVRRGRPRHVFKVGRRHPSASQGKVRPGLNGSAGRDRA